VRHNISRFLLFVPGAGRSVAGRALRIARVVTCALGLVALAGAAMTSAQSNGEAEMALREAMHVEVSEGDLERAVELYRAIVDRFGETRPVAAQALLRMGMSYERLGRREAAAAYEQLVADYADQRAFAAEAGSRLAALRPANGASGTDGAFGANATQLATDLPQPALSFSPDGTRVAMYDFTLGQNIVVMDLESGEVREVTDSRWGRDSPNPSFYDMPAVWSPDGTRLALTKGVLTPGAGEEAFYWEVGVVGLDGSWRSVHRGEVQGQGNTGVWITDWLPDGRGFVGVLQRRDRSYALGIFSAEAPSFTPIRSLGWDFSGYERRPDVSPDGRFIVFEDGPPDAGDIRVVSVDGEVASLVTDHPADDRDPVWSPDGRHVVFLSRRLGSYGLWGVAMENGRPAGEPFLIQDGMEDTTLLDWVASGLAFSRENMLQDAFTMAVDPVSLAASGDPIQVRYPLTGKTEWARFSPDGRHIAFVHDRREVVVMSADGRDARTFPLPTTGGFPRNFQWLPDSSAVSFLKGDDQSQQTIYRMDVVRGDVASWREPELMVYPPFFAWTGRGNSVYYIQFSDFSKGGRIVERNLDTGVERTVLSEDAIRAGVGEGEPIWIIHHLTTSPDLRSLAFHANRGGQGPGSTWVLDVQAGAIRKVFDQAMGDEQGGPGFISWSPDSRRIHWATASVDVVDGTVRRFTGLGTDRFAFVDEDATVRSRHWAPDGRTVLFTVQVMSPELWLMRDVIPSPPRAR